MDWAERVGRRLQLRDLHVLLAVAQCGSMTKASQQLAISHPVVSKTISDLERTLGVKLFDRHSQGVEPTPHGRALLRCGTAVFDEMRQGLIQLDHLSNPTSGELNIGCPEGMIAGTVMSVADRFCRQYPNVQLHVLPALLDYGDLRARNVELLIGRSHRPIVETDLDVENLFNDQFVVVAGADTRFAKLDEPTFAEILDEPWILPPRDSVPGHVVWQIFEEGDVTPPTARITSLSLQLTTGLIAKGNFVGILPSSVVKLSAYQSQLKILPIKIAQRFLATDLITIRNRTLSPLAGLFIQCTREVVKDSIGRV